MEFLNKPGQRILDSCTTREMGCRRYPRNLCYTVACNNYPDCYIILPNRCYLCTDQIELYDFACTCVVLFNKSRIYASSSHTGDGREGKELTQISELSSYAFQFVAYWVFVCSLTSDCNNFSALVGSVLFFVYFYFPDFFFSLIFCLLLGSQVNLPKQQMST